MSEKAQQVWIVLWLLASIVLCLQKSGNLSEKLANESDKTALKTFKKLICSVGLPLFLEAFPSFSENLVGKPLFFYADFQQVFVNQ